MTTASNTSPETARSGATNAPDGSAERKAFVPPRLRTHDTVQKRTATTVIWS